MVNPSFIFIRAMNSTLWIAILVVHVGCIIEVQPSKTPSASSGSSSLQMKADDDKQLVYSSSFELTSASSYNGRQNPERNNIVQKQYRIRKFFSPTLSMLTSTTTSTTTKPIQAVEMLENEDDDSCTGKTDGYYQNFGSNCVSYYFCAAGYQITYLCQMGEKFNGKKCDDEFECPKKKGRVNSCADVPNGYYPNLKYPGKYFYCFQKSKVIELQCGTGKVFIEDECTFPSQEIDEISQNSPQILTQSPNLKFHSDNSKVVETGSSSSCMKKSNGFYVDDKSNCKKYYYCINGDKTQLECQSGFLFNTKDSICVHSSRYICPTSPTKEEATPTAYLYTTLKTTEVLQDDEKTTTSMSFG